MEKKTCPARYTSHCNDWGKANETCCDRLPNSTLPYPNPPIVLCWNDGAAEEEDLETDRSVFILLSADTTGHTCVLFRRNARSSLSLPLLAGCLSRLPGSSSQELTANKQQDHVKLRKHCPHHPPPKTLTHDDYIRVGACSFFAFFCVSRPVQESKTKRAWHHKSFK